MRTRLQGCSLILVGTAFMLHDRNVHAQIMGAGGIVINIPDNNKMLDIRDIELQHKYDKDGNYSDLVSVKFSNGTRTIHLPSGSLPFIAEYENSQRRKQLIISADNYLFGASPDGPFRIEQRGPTLGTQSDTDKHLSFAFAIGEVTKDGDAAKQLIIEYAHDEGINEKFALALLAYDAYADAVICDENYSRNLSDHPLARDKHPDRSVVDVLKDPRRGGPFRQMASSLSTPPTCIGELSLSYNQIGDGLPQVTAQTRRWFIGYRWDQEMVVLDEAERTVADWPYQQLGNDISSRWNSYRKVFHELDELSAIVECLAVLRILKYQHLGRYKDLQAKISNISKPEWHGPQTGALFTKHGSDRVDEWQARAKMQVGGTLETEHDAEIALSLRMYRWSSRIDIRNTSRQNSDPVAWESDIERFARNGSPLLKAKIMLVRALETEPAASFPAFNAFFAAVEPQIPQSLGLWLQSLRWLKLYCYDLYKNQTERHRELLSQQRTKALSVAGTRIAQILSGNDAEPTAATRFLEIAFGTRLLDLATVKWADKDDDGKFESPELVDFVENLAKVHLQSIRETNTNKPDRLLLFTHHRYLGYLADKVPKARSTIDQTRKAILNILTQSD